MSTFLITGTSRGLGLGLVAVLASLPPDSVKQIFAASRAEAPTSELEELIAQANGRVKHITLDVASTASIDKAAAQVALELKGGGLDYLINNAAVRDPEPVPEIENMDFLAEALATNVTGTHEVTRAFLPLLRQGRAKKIVFFSSTLGQATTAQSDPSLMEVPLPAYKISKAGTHMVVQLWSNRLREDGFCVYMQSPGNLKTKLAGGDRADLAVEVGAREVVRIALEAGPKDTGRHRNIYVKGWENGGGVGGRYDGKDLPW